MRNKIVALCSGVMFVLMLVAVAQAQAPAKVAGAWTMTNMGRNGVVTTLMTLTQDGATLKGSLKAENGMEVMLDSGTIMGSNIDFTVTRQGRNGAMMVEYKGTVDGDTMKGTFMAGQNSVDWTAKRN
jgi:hypothetical protein